MTVGGDASPPVAAYPRLALAVRLVHRVAAARNAYGWLAPMTARMTAQFGHDRDFVRGEAMFRDLSGLHDDAGEADATDWPLRALATQAQDGGNAALTLALILAGGDRQAITATMDAAMAQEMQGDKSALGTPDMLFGLVHEAGAWLDREQIETLVLAPLAGRPFRDGLMFDLLLAAPARYERLENILGHPLLTGARLAELMSAQRAGPIRQWQTLARERMPIDHFAGLLTARLSRDEILTLAEGMTAAMLGGGGDSALHAPIVADLLRHPLTEAQQGRLLALLQRDIGFERDAQTPSAGPIVPKFLVFDAAPGNRDLLLRAARMVANRYADGRDLPGLLDAWYAGHKDDAWQLLTRLQASTSAHYRGPDYATALRDPWFTDSAGRTIARFLDDPAPGIDVARSFYRDRVLPALRAVHAPSASELRRYYEKLHGVDPQEQSWMEGLLAVMLQQNDLVAFTGLLAPFVDAHRDDLEAASTLQLAYLMQDRAEAAHALAVSGGVDVTDPNWLGEMVNRTGGEMQALGGPDMRSLFGSLYARWSERSPVPAAVAALRAQTGQDASSAPGAPDPLAPLLKSLSMAEKADPGASVASTLRGLWRASIETGSQGEPPARGALVAALAQAARPDGAPLLAQLARVPALADELDAYLAALSPEARIADANLYAVLAALLVTDGRADGRLAQLTAMLEQGEPTPHELRLYVALANRRAIATTPALMDRLAARLRTMPAMGASDRLALARLYSRGGDLVTAGALLEAAELQATTDSMPTEQINDLLTDMADLLRTWPDRAMAARVHDRIARSVLAQQGGPDAAALIEPKDLIALPPLNAGAS